MRIEVAYVDPAHEWRVSVDVAPDATVADAVAQSGLAAQIGLPNALLGYAIYGRRVDPVARLNEGDRVEITRPLVCDPKVSRRLRAAKQQKRRSQP